ncbi:E3 UFM1-protein ligase 1-like [Oppia nitens]|uniref:E3 UFM1-protein ligase 1-like n=1 Tax=Oppia nitens TaxID=1686743 RepID=UPI0023D9DA32|nr:E3 UFM1-protein ligase 1-like [Oppia nitens]
MATDWEEVKRLAADFQRTQLSQTLLRLSERNCVEIMRRLIDMKLLDVYFTSDGKEYVTDDQLLREIEDELYNSGGRISLATLAANLNLDYAQVESKSGQLSRTSSGDVSLVLGQLVSRQYKDSLAQEVDLKLQESGVVTIAELTKQYDLSADFLDGLITERLGSLVRGRTDPNDPRVILTNDYLAQYQSKVKGVLSAVTRPVALQTIINRYKFTENLFNSIVNDLISTKRLSGSLSGRTYIPEIYAKTQLEYVESFYKLNGYLDYSTLNRLGITNAQSYLQKRFGDQLCYLNTCAVGQLLNFQVESSIEECILNNSWIDLVTVMPSILSDLDINILIQKTLEQNKNLSDPTVILCDTLVVSKTFIAKLEKLFEPLMNKKAADDLASGLLLSLFAAQKSAKLDAMLLLAASDDGKSHRKSGGGGGGGKKGGGGGGGSGGSGSQGREIKTKAVKKKYKPGAKQSSKAGGDDSDNDDNQSSSSSANELTFLTVKEIETIVTKNIADIDDCPPDFIKQLALRIHGSLRTKYETIARQVFIASTTASSAKAKKSFSEVQKLIQQLYTNILLFDKGIKVLTNDELQQQLTKYLLRSLCSDIVNHLVIHFTTSEDIASIANPEVRLKLIGKLHDPNLKECIVKLNQTINGKSVDDFIAELDTCVGSGKCEIMLKRLDKKRERSVIAEHRQSLIQQLNESAAAAAVNDGQALALNLAVLLLFHRYRGELIHASGKFVPKLLDQLKSDLDTETYQLLYSAQELVIKQLSSSTTTKEPSDAIQQQLSAMIDKIKELAIVSLSAKKQTND